ncbi:hypothetical protein [Streptomyces sp. NBC_01435]|uniref:hypothetical protein n=1 Tax=Streptomyces sp. NBC_01435 TaxID=2903865 RepID=UPI002E3729BA|nr:hypothetical protein [Streptomyces sp. NBC_01435]
MRSLQGTQNVHSYEQMRAGEPCGSAAFPHRSQLSRISKATAPPAVSDTRHSVTGAGTGTGTG